MNRTAIYSKTGKGVQESTGKTSNLSRADRAVLSAIDGKTNVAALYKKFEKTPEPKFHQLLEKLDREGYIREASPGVVAQPSSRPAAPPAAKPMDAISDLDFTGVFAPIKSPPASVPKPPSSVPKPPPSVPKPPASVPKAPASVPKAPPIDFAAKARAEAEKRAQESALDYRARQAAEEKAKAEAEARARDTASAPSRADDDSRIRAEAERKLKEAQEMALRIGEEEKARADKVRAEAEAKAKAEEEERKRKAEEARKAREVEERKRKEEEEARKRKEEEERKRREEEEARRRKEEEERKRREEEERKRKEEEERRRREEEEARRRKEEEERKRREEEERRRREEEEARRRKEEEERRRKEEEERRRKEEEERRRREEEEARKRREEEERRREEEQEARRRKEEETAAAASGGDSFADSLLADLDSFSQQGERARKAHEESERKAAAARKAKEQADQEALAKREEEAQQQRADEAAARKAREATSDGRAKRRLAAIVAADVVGYSRLMGIDEEGTLTRFRRMMREIIQPKVEEHNGRIVKTAGDGLLIEFPSVVDAVRFAVQVQTSVANEEAEISRSRQIAFRMGVNLGDIIGEDNDVYGDGVNVAARLEALADKGGICIAGVVFDQIRDKVAYSIEALGEQKLKNIPRPVRAYKIKGDWETTKLRRATEPGSLPHPSARSLGKRPVEEEDVVVSDEDLDMDEVRRDQQALTKESRKAARLRAREEKRQKKEKAKAEKPVKIRRPRKWGRPVAITLVVALVAAVGALPLMPVPTAEYAKAASAAIGRPVVIRSAHYSVLNGLELQLEGVSIGKIRIATARAYPQLGALFTGAKSFRRIELDGALVPQGELGDLLLGRLKPVGFSVTRVVAKQVVLSGPVALRPLDIDALISHGGSIASVKLSGRDKLNVKLYPKDGHVAIEGTAGAFSPPFAPDVSFTDFSFKGSATRDGMALSEWDGALLEGDVAGTARIRWGRSWSVDGTLKFKRVNAAVFAPALLLQGAAEGSGSFAMQGRVPAKLGDAARIQGRFTIGRGVLGTFDLSRIIQTAGKEVTGRTQFAALTGKGVYDRGAVALRDVNITAGALSAGAAVDIAPNGKLSGRVVADVKTAGHVLRSAIDLTGTVTQPEVKK